MRRVTYASRGLSHEKLLYIMHALSLYTCSAALLVGASYCISHSLCVKFFSLGHSSDRLIINSDSTECKLMQAIQTAAFSTIKWRNGAKIHQLQLLCMPHGAGFEIGVNEDEAVWCVEGFSQCLKKDLKMWRDECDWKWRRACERWCGSTSEPPISLCNTTKHFSSTLSRVQIYLFSLEVKWLVNIQIIPATQ